MMRAMNESHERRTGIAIEGSKWTADGKQAVSKQGSGGRERPAIMHCLKRELPLAACDRDAR